MSASQLAFSSFVLQLVMSLNYDAIVNHGVNLRDLCEECDTSTGSGYAHHPRYCHLFVHCSLGGDGQLIGQVKECTRGLLWSQAVKQCVWPDQSDCPDNPCRNRSLSFRDVRNCNGYFTCPSGTRLDYHCCPSDQRYSEGERVCVLDPSCGDPCLPGSANVTAKTPECGRYPVEGQPSQYLWAVGGRNITMTCASGTAFSSDFCSCTESSALPSDEKCEPYIWFPFDVDIKDQEGRTASGGNADVSTSQRGAVGRGAAHFAGNQKVVAWAMNNMEFRSNFTLTFRFKADLPDPKGTESLRYALVDNSDCDKEATFGVALLTAPQNRASVHGGFRLKNGRAFTASSERLSLNGWHDVVLMKRGPRAQLTVDGNDFPIEGEGLESDIDIVDCSMTIGTGTGLLDFVGYIDEVKYYKCVPSQYL
ncbi:protein PIF-like [Babylonia areolata]|uniref:protein PIF-like n=1 Tax=Babylonia areolata TaxID=304850 RepID=UPI003FD38E37